MENVNTIKTIDATLKLNANNEEVIEISFIDKTFELNFTKEDQSYLRNFFKRCIEVLLEDRFAFEFKEDGTVKNEMIISVAKSYIEDLNKELKNCFIEITKTAL